MREAIAALMARSKREIPHYYLELQIDMTRALDWLHENNLRRALTERLLPSALLLSAVAHAAAEMPELNGFWVDGAFKAGNGVHLGVAISLRGGGLIAPALARRRPDESRRADGRHCATWWRARAAAGCAARRCPTRRSPSRTSASGESISCTGSSTRRRWRWSASVECASGRGQRAGMLGVRPVVIATLAADHRASDGHTGSRFLTLIEHRLQKPEEL